MSSSLCSLLREQIQNFLNSTNSDDISGVYHTFLRETEIALIETTLLHTQGNQSNASKLLGLNRNTLRRKIKEYQIDTKQLSLE